MLRRILLEILYRLHIKKRPEPMVYWTNCYDSFERAMDDCKGGYSDETIFNRVSENAMKVYRGEAAYERDGYLFYDNNIDHLLMMYIYKTGLDHDHKEDMVRVLDYGGSLGSTYFQHISLLKEVNVKWYIKEQIHFVEFGKNNLEDDRLCFVNDVDTTIEYDIILLNAVLHYLPNPQQTIKQMCDLKAKYIVLGRTPMGKKEIITKEVVHEPIYEAQYPSFLFEEHKIRTLFEEYGYINIDDYLSGIDGTIYVKGNEYRFKTQVYKKYDL